jgi:hypothetical protein
VQVPLVEPGRPPQQVVWQPELVAHEIAHVPVGVKHVWPPGQSAFVLQKGSHELVLGEHVELAQHCEVV